MKTVKQLLTTAIIVMATTTTLSQTTRYVAGNGTDSGDCTNSGNPCATVSYAIVQASPGDIIEIAGSAAYTENIVINKSLSLHGADAGNTVLQAHTSPGQAGAGRVITIVGSYVVAISGLTIRNGVADGASPNNRGGGIYNNSATLDLTDVTFSDNIASFGGGMFNLNSSPTLTNVIFDGNEAASRGGGMYNGDSSPTLTNVTFNGNGAAVSGGGMRNFNSSPTLTNVHFIDNSALGSGTNDGGGGMYNLNSSPTLTDVLFQGNEARDGGGVLNINSSGTLANVSFTANNATRGGGIHNYNGSSPVITNAVFVWNNASFGGGGMFNIDNSSPILSNISFSGNTALNSTGGGGAMRNASSSSPVLKNVIIWNNRVQSSTTLLGSSITNTGGSSPAISYSLIANSGGSSGWDTATGIDSGNNIDADPLFITTPDFDDPNSFPGNLRLQENSPAIDTGDPATDLSLFPGGPGDPVDILGNPRVYGAAIDMGAYEWDPNLTVAHLDDGVPGFILYPNPVRDILHYSADEPISRVALYNLLGQEVILALTPSESGGTNLATLDLSGLASGVYVLRVKAGGQEGVYRIVKK